VIDVANAAADRGDIEESPTRLGVSSCLLGERVRWDRGHKLDHFIVDTLGPFVEFVPVCPEVEAGFGIPREPMRLVGDIDSPRLVTVRSGVDHTARMAAWAGQRVEELAAQDLCGFVFKKDSPSSGMERVKVYGETGMPVRRGSGLFARAFRERFPLLPTEDEGRLNDPALRENFIERVFTLKRWREQVASHPGRGALVDFHTTHKLLILSHSEKSYRELGPLVAAAKSMPLPELLDRYRVTLMRALRLIATPAKHVNVLQHAMGYFKKQLTSDEKQELLEVIASYRKGDLPLIVPITLVNHYVRRYEQPYLARQYYLHPHPTELRLRNHA
jgi:uncharacterized protein YbgA (DUF1722 family)/uncharacterized protein YbbK (DUF523 family)